MKYYKFEESSLLNWTFSYSIDDLINALNDFNNIGSGLWQKPNPLWECLNTHIRFHGKASMSKYIDNTISDAEMEDDKQDLISRIKYLKEKFLNIAKSEKRKLYIYKIKSQNIDDSVDTKILDLLKSLKYLGANNFKLLIVAEKENTEKFNNHSDEYCVDFVDHFPPDNDVTNKKYHKNGWNRIFNKISVLKPKNYTKKKKYKYENHEDKYTKYDLIFSLGQACSSAQALISSNLRLFSCPFDWLWGADFSGRIKIFTSDFNRFIEKSDLISCEYNNGDKNNLCDVYKNEYTNLFLNHDFPAGIPLDESYPMVAEKYKRRINRLLDNIKNADSLLIVYIETPNNENHTSDKDIICGWEKIKEKYPNKKIDILYFLNDMTLPPKSVKKENITSNIIKVTANYKNQSPDAVPYAVDNDVLKNVLKEYRLKTSLGFEINRITKKILIKLIPIKSIRKKLRKKYHV